MARSRQSKSKEVEDLESVDVDDVAADDATTLLEEIERREADLVAREELLKAEQDKLAEVEAKVAEANVVPGVSVRSVTGPPDGVDMAADAIAASKAATVFLKNLSSHKQVNGKNCYYFWDFRYEQVQDHPFWTDATNTEAALADYLNKAQLQYTGRLDESPLRMLTKKEHDERCKLMESPQTI